MGITLMKALEDMPRAKLEKVKHAIAVGDNESIMRIVRAEGYQDPDSPKDLGEKVKRMLRR